MNGELLFALNIAFKLLSKFLPIPECVASDNGVTFKFSVKDVDISVNIAEKKPESVE